ncbi:MAG: hypothetical protein ACM32F_13490 [Betaproteobacteria bacterium]
MGSALPLPAEEVSPALRRFCLAQANAFVVPAEVLGEHGVESAFGALLVREQRLSADQLACLDSGFRLYWQRCRALHAAAPGAWFPPRQTNLLVVAEARGILPYLEPFRGTSSMLYTADLDTHPEYVAALLVHMERLSLLRSVPATIAYNLSYWFERDAASRMAFTDAARRARRPDAAAFVALAEALGWVDELLQDPLRVPQQELTEPHLHIDGADLYVPKRLQPQLMALGAAAEDAVRAAVAAPAVVASRSGALDALCDWLLQSRAHVIVHGPHGGTLWTPQHDDPIRVRRVLADANDDAVASIHADLRTIDERSRQFLGRVHDVDALPTRCSVLETGGGTYIDAARRAVVYEIQQPAFNASAVAAPPYHRLLLGARVMHEWGHIAHTAKILRLPEANRPAYFEARAELGTTFARVVAAIPEPQRTAVAEELQSIEPDRDELPKALARKTLARVGDYLANLMSSRLIPNEEMQAYVRTNVTHHLDEQLGLVSELARYAYEIHYLDLAGLPRSYFYGTSRFPDHFIDTGIVSAEDAEALFDAAGRVLACYAIDESRLTLPAPAAH